MTCALGRAPRQDPRVAEAEDWATLPLSVETMARMLGSLFDDVPPRLGTVTCMANKRRRYVMYDYVIVGAGSAGCVLACRLSEDPQTQVLLIEAGGVDTSDLIHMPLGFLALMRSDKDWDYSSGYEPQCNNRRVYLPRGRVLGGSSSINFMVYIRGNPRDYDEWSELGCDGWSWK